MGPSGPRALPPFVGQLEDQLRAAEGHPSGASLVAPGNEFSFGGSRRALESQPSLEEHPWTSEVLLSSQSCVETMWESGGASEDHEVLLEEDTVARGEQFPLQE